MIHKGITQAMLGIKLEVLEIQQLTAKIQQSFDDNSELNKEAVERLKELGVTEIEIEL